MTRIISLHSGESCPVDDGDYEDLAQFNWCLHKANNSPLRYAIRRFKDDGRWTIEYMHRRIMGNPKGMDVDHLNGRGLDNRRANLRICTRAENIRNSRNTQGKGASYDKRTRKWFARISHNGERIFLGRFPSQEAAFAAVAERRAALYTAQNPAHGHPHSKPID